MKKLLILALIVGIAAFTWSRLMSEEDDFSQ